MSIESKSFLFLSFLSLSWSRTKKRRRRRRRREEKKKKKKKERRKSRRIKMKSRKTKNVL